MKETPMAAASARGCGSPRSRNLSVNIGTTFWETAAPVKADAIDVTMS